MATVKYSRIGDIDTIEIGLPGLDNIIIDYTGVAQEERNGIAKALLCASAMSCYIGSLSGALEARDAKVEEINAEAHISLGPNEAGQGRAKEIKLDVEVGLDEASASVFERCTKIMKNGCLVTASLHDGIKMEYDLKAKYKA